MAGSINKVILIGNLGKDPEVKFTQSGKKVVHLTLVTSDSWKDKQSGERKENTEWHRVVIFNEHLADVADKYLSKGRKIFVEGALKTRKYNDKQGVEKYVTEVVLERFKGALELFGNKDDGKNQPTENNQSKMSDDLDDQMPF